MRPKQRWVCGHKKRVVVIKTSAYTMAEYLGWQEKPEPKKCPVCYFEDKRLLERSSLSLNQKEKVKVVG